MWARGAVLERCVRGVVSGSAEGVRRLMREREDEPAELWWLRAGMYVGSGLLGRRVCVELPAGAI